MEIDYVEILDKLEEFVQLQRDKTANEFRKIKDNAFRKENIRQKLAAIKVEIEKQTNLLFPEQIKPKDPNPNQELGFKDIKEVLSAFLIEAKKHMSG